MNSDPLALSTTGQNATQISWILKRLVGMWDKACSDLCSRTPITASRSGSPGLSEGVYPSGFQFLNQEVNYPS